MPSPICELAIGDATRVGNAILKYISANDAGLTGAHQCGFYLPKPVWEMYAKFPPKRGRNDESAVTVTWQGGQRVTDSRVKWYGAAKSEYRLTRFGKDFPFLTPDSVGDLFVLIPEDLQNFKGYVLDTEEDIEDLQAALGVEVTAFWAAYRNRQPQVETEDQCVERHFRKFIETLRDAFPSGETFSKQTQDALLECFKDFAKASADKALMRCVDAEYKLFRMAERQICQPQIVRVFKDVDDFLATASSIMNRRKARAGRALENHFEYLLKRAAIPHVIRPSTVDGKPDIIIPSVAAYEDRRYPNDKLFMVGVKTTCKDRWRQVLNEAKRIQNKYILTTQQGISTKQLKEMKDAHVQLIVPADLHTKYPPRSEMKLLPVDGFLQAIRRKLA